MSPNLQRHRLRLILATFLIVAGFLSLFEWRERGRPNGTASQLQSLPDRSDLNLLWIVIDTLRADRLGSYGYSRPTSPVMDALAEGGIRFADVLAQSSWTKSSMASLWTATHPSTHGILRYFDALPQAALLPAEILGRAGFRRAGVWRNGWVAPNFGFDQGFERYVRPVPGTPPKHLGRRGPHRVAGSDADVTQSAVDFLRSAQTDRWLLYLHFMDVHQYAYDEGSALFGTSYSDIYDNAIRWVDANVGQVLGELERLQLLDRTVVAIVADHGEAFYEHGREGHARDLYREVVHTPWILSLPFRLEEPIVVQRPVENIDVWPTLLALLGAPPLEGAEGRSRLPEIEAAAKGGGEPPEKESMPRYAQLDRSWGRVGAESDSIVAVAEDSRRLIFHAREPDRVELYDHRSDPAEREDLAASQPQEAAALQRRAEAYLNRPPAPWGAPSEVTLDAMQLGQLRALGYVLEAGESPGRGEPSP